MVCLFSYVHNRNSLADTESFYSPRKSTSNLPCPPQLRCPSRSRPAESTCAVQPHSPALQLFRSCDCCPWRYLHPVYRVYRPAVCSGPTPHQNCRIPLNISSPTAVPDPRKSNSGPGQTIPFHHFRVPQHLPLTQHVIRAQGKGQCALQGRRLQWRGGAVLASVSSFV